LITNSPLSELDERVVATVAFQQAPSSAVDDLVVTARSNDGSIPIGLAIACRRRPQFTRGNAKTKELFAQLVHASRAADDDNDVDQRLAVAVAGSQGGALEVSELAGVARNQHDPAGFFDLINGSGQFSNKLRTRLAHLRDLVQLAQAANGEPDVTAEERCWRLLTQLRVLGLSIEPSDDQDWVDLVSLLKPWAAKGTMESAIALRNQLEALAAEYAQTAAAVDANTVRRRVHLSIDSSAHRTSVGWSRLKLLDAEARAAVSRSLVGSGVNQPLKLARSELQTNLAASLAQGTEDLVVRGESGVGKSALVFDAMEKAASEDCEFIAVNLRDLPQTILELLNALSVPLEELLAGMTAPRRILVVDAAEAVAESKKDVFAHILRAARRSGVKVVAVAAEAAGAVAEDMKVGGNAVTEFEVSGLSDDEVSQAVDHFAELDRLATSPKGRELLRRPIVIELLSRAGGSRTPLSDAEAHSIVWHELVRNGERHDAGLPDEREQTMLSLATSALSAPTSQDSLGTLDAPAVNGLIKSGLLRRSGSLPWEREPTFAHDLLREYSVARVLVAMKDPAAELRRFEAPRWTLPAARLACQLVLTNPGNPGDIPTLFRRLQSDFEELATSAFGERWVDVPTEALVAMAEPATVLERAWDFLIESEAAGVRRLIRVLDLRHRKDHFIDTLVADPIVAQLVKAGTPQGLGEEAAELTKDWLTAHVLGGTPAGHPVRTALANKIVTQCTNNEAEAERRDAEAAAARAARTPEEIAEEEERIKKFAAFSEIGFPRRRRRVPKRRRPYDWIDDEAITHLALLGPDLGSEGEAILRRIADDEPGSLDHAVETPLAGSALALFDPNLLVDLVAAYYLEDEYEDDAGFGYSGIHEDGIRDHRFGGIGGPLAAYYKGPFITMFRTNYRAGVACLNKLLNHAARHRVRTLANIGYPNAAPDEEDRYKVELSITGDKRAYIGDDHVWLWYRGTGVGPYPCMSALQALELVNDELIRVGIPVTQLVPILLEGAESLAMPALVLGTLVRHLEQSGDALFPFLVEPSVWELEFARHVHESGGLAARTPDLDHPERRSWSLRETSMMLTLQAQGDRVVVLKELGDQIIAAVKAQIGDNESDAAKQHLAAVQGWAASLDRNAYEIKEHEGQYVIQQAPNPEIEAVLAGPNAELLRGNETLGLTLRHVHNRTEDDGAYGMSSEELAKDLATARELIENPPSTGMGTSPDGPVAVAASAIELFFARGIQVTTVDLEWSAQIVLEVAGSVAERPLRDGDPSYFMQGVDRSAARALPHLLLPAARDLRAALGIDTGDANDLLVSLNEAVAVGASNEARLEYARSLDEVWHAPCPSEGKCHHQVAFEVVQASFRDCILGPWDNEGQKREIVPLKPPFVESLAKAQEDQILVDQLGPAIRALGSAGISEACCRQEARDALDVLLAAHRRGMLAYEHGYMHSDSDSLIAARAALWQVIDGREQPLLNHVAGYLSNSRLLAESLRAINAAAEERGPAAEAARRLWPTVMELVLDAADANPHILSERRHGDRAFSELIPNPTYAFGYLTLELEHESVKWRDLLSWPDQVEHWVSMASGRESIDALVTAVGELAREDQVRIGLSWIERVVHASGNNRACTYTLPEWLHERRADLTTSEQQARWQRVVDLLLLAGDRRVADLAD
jgi:hypothetical protein